MGKSIKSGQNISSKKGNVKKITKTNKKSDGNSLRKKPDIIETYLRTLSNNFRSTSTENTNSKRKHGDDDAEECPNIKKPKLVEDYSSYSKENIQTSNAITDIKFERLLTHLDSEDELKDLFHIDERKSNNEHTYYVDWLHELCDEISLEGLDGITLEALWARMKSNSPYPVLLEGKEHILWNLLKCIDKIEFYILEHPRGSLMIYDKNSFVCPESGLILEPVIDYAEIYPYLMVNRDGVRGSCSTFESRMENSTIIRKLGLKEALSIYGTRLVVVASQKMRENAILFQSADPTVELGDNEYGLLERVGRSRGFGELTQGKVSVLSMIKDSRSIFHLRKTLERKKLLKNQFFMLRNGDNGLNKTGKLLHLPRFYRFQKNKTLLLIEEIVELLRQKPGFSLEFGEFRRYFPRSTGANKILKSPEFNKYIKTDIFRPYRHLYPNAAMSEWKYKNRNKEKVLRIFQLIDPTINVAATWNNADNEENLDDELGDDDGRGYKYFDSEFLREVFSSIFKAGKQGITLQELVRKVNLDYYTIRIALRKLQAKNVTDTFRTEHGKQRHIYYFARCFHSKNIPVPVSQTTKIPENILQKILQNKKTSENKELRNNSTITINSERVRRLISPHFPLRCLAFVTHRETTGSETIHENSLKDWRAGTFRPKPTKANLCDIRIIPKFEKIAFEPITKLRTFIDPINVITTYSDQDKTIKVILLKLVIMELHINLQNMLAGNKNEQIQDISLDFEALTSGNKRFPFNIYFNNKDYLLGPDPIVLCHEKNSENIELTITQSTLPKAYITEYTAYASFDKNATALSLSRTNMILEEINKQMVICDIHKLQKIIMDLEKELPDKKEGQGKMDKNTLQRILLRLMNEGYIKIFKYFMMSVEKYKAQWILAHPTIDITHPLLRASQEQMVVRFFLGMDKRNLNNTVLEKPTPKPPPVLSPFDSEEATLSTQRLKEISSTKSTVSYKTNRLFGRILGYQPKFVRMQLFHELLYYIIYDYEPLEMMSHSDIEQVYQYYNQNELREIPPIYQKKIDWKMFIPPLPVHKDYTDGWTLLCDVILSIPLSLWVKLFHISLECPNLFAYLEHPVRQHYLIKDIPLEYRYILMYKRKYLFNAVEIVYRLCFIGLVQLGPQSAVIKDQIFLYLNKKASLLDTSTSGPSYHKITPQTYEKLSFNFSSKAEVENYWCQLWTISMNTPLGQRRIMEGKSVTIERSVFKSMLLDTLKPKTPSEAIANDCGDIPGDQQGASGLDSSMWFHIKRNWLWSSKSPKISASLAKESHRSIRNANIACIKPVTIRYKELMSQSRKIFFKADQKGTKYSHADNVNRHGTKSNIIHRNIKLRKVAPKLRKDECDAKDKLIMKKVGKIFRAKFSQNEDKVLYICRAANCFLSKNMKAVRISRFLVRDIMHILCPESQDKTSGACARRMTKLERSDISMKRLKERTHELINLKDLSVHFSPIIFNLNKSNTYSPYSTIEKCVALVHVIWYIYQNFNVVERILQGQANNIDFFSPTNIDTLSPLLVNVENGKTVFSSPSNEEDVIKEAIKSVLMSSLHCPKSGQNTSYQFYQMCKKYSDQCIRAAVTSSKGYQAISLRKKARLSGNVIRSIPFQLSVTYNHMQKSNFSCLTMHTIYQHFQEITGGTPHFAEVDAAQPILRYSRLLARNELSTALSEIGVLLNIPDSAHVLYPYVKNKNILINKLAELYQRYLKQRLQEIDNPIKTYKRVTNKISTNILQPSKCPKALVSTKSNVNRLLSSLPCFVNKTIVENLSSFMKCTDEDQINRFLEIFIDSLIIIVFNLLSTKTESLKLLERYIAKFHTYRSINTTTRLLEQRLFKVGYIVREFLMKNQLMDFIHCFESELLQEKDEQCEETLRAWLEKSQINSSASLNTNKDKKTATEQKTFSGFFRHKMIQTDDNSPVKIISNMDDIPEVEEIVKGMMEPFSTNMKRSIPHISDMIHVLSQERYPNEDDQKLIEELKELFIVQYPTLDRFEIGNLDEFKGSCDHLFTEKRKPDIKKIIHRYCHIRKSSNVAMVEKIKEKGGTSCDHLLAGEIIGYVFNQKVTGVTGPKLKELFHLKAKTLNIEIIVEIICDSFIFLEVGITEKTFVHIEHADAWLVETFHLSPQENHLLDASGNNQLQLLQERIESRLNSTKPVKVIMMLWLHLDGTINYPLLHKWLTILLSYCLESPGCSLPYIFEKFYLVKPVELYLLLKILQELKCLEVVAVNNTPESLWSDMMELQTRPANILDRFEDMVVNVQPLATISLGHYFDKENVTFE